MLNLCAEERFDPPETSYAAAGITCLRMHLVDQPTQEILPHLPEALAFITACLQGACACACACASACASACLHVCVCVCRLRLPSAVCRVVTVEGRVVVSV